MKGILRFFAICPEDCQIQFIIFSSFIIIYYQWIIFSTPLILLLFFFPFGSFLPLTLIYFRLIFIFQFLHLLLLHPRILNISNQIQTVMFCLQPLKKYLDNLHNSYQLFYCFSAISAHYFYLSIWIHPLVPLHLRLSLFFDDL